MPSAAGAMTTSLLRSLNHVSRVCHDVEATSVFYRELLGFLPQRRPGFDFEGAWLYSPTARLGIHLIKGTPVQRPSSIDPKADHLSFVCTSLVDIEQLLVQRNVPHVKQCIIEEDGVRVTQIFFHDPENNMIEICNCDELPVELLVDLACPTCQAKPTASQPEWEGVVLGGKLNTGHHDDAMSDDSAHSGAAREHAETPLFGSGDSSSSFCNMSVEPVA